MSTPRTVLAAAALLLTLTACGGSTETPAPAPAPEASTEAPSTAPSSEAGSSAPSSAGTGSSSAGGSQIPGTARGTGTITIGGTETDLGDLQCVTSPAGTIITSVSPTTTQGFAAQLGADGAVTSFAATVGGKPLVFTEGGNTGGELTSSASGTEYTISGTLPDLTAGGGDVEVEAVVSCG